jgi:hypothetical protein
MNYIIIVTIKKKKKQYLDQFFQSNYPSRTIWPLVLKMQLTNAIISSSNYFYTHTCVYGTGRTLTMDAYVRLWHSMG